MEKLILMLILTILCGIKIVDCLQCYVCNDCPTVNDKFLVTCGGSAISTTTLPTTLTTTTQASGNETNTTVTNTTSALETTIITNATTPMTTTQTSINTTTTPTPPVSEINTTSAPNNTINNRSIEIISALRTRREVFEKKFGEIIPGYRASNTTLVYCYLSKLKVNTKEKIVRGCASKLVSSNRTICDEMATDPTVTACRTCTTDKCNSAFPTRISILLLIIATPLSFY